MPELSSMPLSGRMWVSVARALTVAIAVTTFLVVTGPATASGAIVPEQVGVAPTQAGSPIMEASAVPLNVTDIRGDGIPATVRAIDTVMARFRTLHGGYKWDAASGALVVRLVTGTDSATVEAVKSQVRAAASAPGLLPVTFGLAPRPYDEINAAARRLFETRDSWAPDPSAVIGSYADEGTGTIVLDVRADQASQIRSLISDPTVRVDLARPSRPEAGHRRADLGYWTAGNALQHSYSADPAGDAYCTQGFTWQLWGTNTRYGGLANHCVAGTYTVWYHNRRYVGSIVRTSPASDSALIGPAANTSFSATVWVGGRTTTDERPVKGVAIAVDGQQVALSGANSGLTVDVVREPAYNSQFGSIVVMTGNYSVGGDSGGPWLTTRSGTGDAVAYGQHYGDFYVGGAYRSSYIPANNISARLSASIVLAP